MKVTTVQTGKERGVEWMNVQNGGNRSQTEEKQHGAPKIKTLSSLSKKQQSIQQGPHI